MRLCYRPKRRYSISQVTRTRTSTVAVPASMGTSCAISMRAGAGEPRGIIRLSSSLIDDDRPELDAGRLSIELGVVGDVLHAQLARLVLDRLGLRHAELDRSRWFGAEAHHLVEDGAELLGVAHGDANRLTDAIADDQRRRGLRWPLLVDGTDREIDGLDVLGVDAVAFQRLDHLGHGLGVLVERLARGQASLVTPVEMSTLSGVALTVPEAASEMVRFCGPCSWALAGGIVQKSAAAARRAKVKKEIRDFDAMMFPALASPRGALRGGLPSTT